MFTLRTGLLIIPAWIAAMSWLVAHDVVPNWTALEPPPIKVSDWTRKGTHQTQFTVFDEFGRVGTVWTSYLIDERSFRREDMILLERLPMDLAPLRFSVSSGFTAQGALDEFTIRLETEDADIRLHGERFPDDFSFRLESGAIDKAFKVPLSDGSLIAGPFHPLAEMRELKVGDKWRMQVVNPMALLTGVGSQFLPVLVEVTGEERITTLEGDKNCMVVESPSAKAWIDASGLVQVQEVSLPWGGQYRIVREAAFDDAARGKARQLSLGGKREKRR